MMTLRAPLKSQRIVSRAVPCATRFHFALAARQNRNTAQFYAFCIGISSARRFGMDQRDRELLDKQMRRLQPTPGQAGALIAVVVGVFLVGVTFGGLMFSSSEPIRVAANDVAVAPLLGTPPMTP
jgi:hypothetical protein